MLHRWCRGIAAFALIALPAISFAGWTSGGGELIRDGQNPWFLANVKSVTYCVEVDEANFGQTRSQVSSIIVKALNNWKLEFRNARYLNSNLGIAAQTFHETSCSANPDIRFQFGVLSGEQLKKLDDPTRFLGVTVRTDYDPVQMRGRGFVYVSPARGPLKIAGEKVVKEPWALENGGLLYLVLVHELGHVFGFPHSSERADLMNERFIEQIFDEDDAKYYAPYWGKFPKPQVFQFSDDASSFPQISACRLVLEPAPEPNPLPEFPGKLPRGSTVRSLAAMFRLSSLDTDPVQPVPGPIRRNSFADEFFGIPKDFKCSEVRLENGCLRVSGNKDTNTPDQLIGTAQLERYDGPADVEPLTSIWLPKEQVVFPREVNQRLMPGPMRQSVSRFKGTYRSTDGKITRDVFVQTTPAYILQIGGLMNAKIVTDLYQGF